MSYFKNQYDVIIIGGGVGGLVCGCYLVKAGMKVLIVEKNDKPGGYCSSFTRSGFSFDACVHSLGSLRQDGILTRALQELNLDTSFKIKRYEPSDVIVSSDCRVCFWNELNKTTQEFQNSFPKNAKHIEKLFNFFINCHGATFNSLRKISFKKLLDQYFKNKKLQAILSLPVLGNIGLSSSKVSAFTATALYREFMFDGGYYPENNMQTLPDALTENFKTLGGDMLSSRLVKGIRVKNNEIKGVILEKDEFMPARYVVSAVDAHQTFLELLGESVLNKPSINKLNKLTPSLSMFVLYLGLDRTLDSLPPQCSNLWSLPYYNVEKLYNSVKNGYIPEPTWYLMHTSLDKKTLVILTSAPFKNEKYWNSHKDNFSENIIKKTEEIIPGIKKSIVVSEIATPSTLCKRTLNYNGAAYGLARTPSQLSELMFSQVISIKNLYLAGHWVALFQGIPGVVYLSRDIAKIILRRKKYE